MTTERKKIGKLFRSNHMKRDAINEEARTVEIAFSSDAPYRRYFGDEILDHDASSIRLGRLEDGAPLLLNHDTRNHIGVVESVNIGTDNKGRAIVRFGKDEESDKVFQKVLDGILKHVSVGYILHKMVLEEESDKGEVYRVTDWEPLELSFTPIPADISVGVGRAAGADEVDTIIEKPNAATEADTPKTLQCKSIENSTQSNQSSTIPKEEKQMPDEKDNNSESKRNNELLDIAEAYAQHGAREMVVDFIRNGKSVEMFKDAIMEKISTKHATASEAEIGMDDEDVKRYSLSRAVNAFITGDWSKAGLERAASDAVATRMGKTPEGFFIPMDKFSRSFNVGTATEGGNLVQTSVLGNEFVDVLRNNMVLAGLGVRYLGGLTGNLAIPRKTSGSSVGMVSEAGAGAGTSVATSQITFSPKRASNYIDYSKQTIIQASLDVDNMMQDDLMKSVALAIQDQAMNGSGAGNNATGLINTSGIGSVVGGTNGLAWAWSHMVDLESACANANAEPDQFSGYMFNTKTRGKLKQVQKATNLDFIWDRDTNAPVNGYRAAVTNTLPSNGTKGTASGITSTAVFGSDWSDLVVALFGGLDIVVDPFTLAKDGQVRITASQFLDIGVRQPASFAAMTDGLTT